MTSSSVLENIHKKGLFGEYESKEQKELIKISEVRNLLIVFRAMSRTVLGQKVSPGPENLGQHKPERIYLKLLDYKIS